MGDAQAHPFPSGAFDVAISRFGTMFFSDPDMAFRNIARAVRAGGRLVMMVWRAHDRNEWAVAIDQALGAGERGVAAAPGSDPFSLAEPPTVRRILAAAGFADSEFRDVDVPVYYGQDVDAALAFVRRFANMSEALSRSAPRAAGYHPRPPACDARVAGLRTRRMARLASLDRLGSAPMRGLGPPLPACRTRPTRE